RWAPMPSTCTPRRAAAHAAPAWRGSTRWGRSALPPRRRSARAGAISTTTMRSPQRCPGTCIRRCGCWSRARAAAPWTASSTRCWPGQQGNTMLLELTRWLQQVEGLFGLFGYLTFRGILAALTALALSPWWRPAVIRRHTQYKDGQPNRQAGQQTHSSMAGTPPLGGALVLFTITASVLLCGDLRNKYVWVVLLVMVCFGAIGWYDDWIKIVKRDPN